MKSFMVLGMVILVTAAVVTAHDRHRRDISEKQLHSDHIELRDQLRSEHSRRKRDTRKDSQTESSAMQAIPAEIMRKYLHEATAQVNAARGAGNDKSAADIVTEYVLKKLLDDGHIDESKLDQLRSEMKKSLKEQKFGKHLDQILKHFDNIPSGVRQMNPHHSQAVGQHPQGYHGNQQHHQASNQNSNRHHGNHDIPTIVKSGEHHPGQRPEHTMGAYHGMDQDDGSDEAHHNAVLTPKSVKDHVSHVFEAVKAMENKTGAQKMLRHFSNDIRGLEKRDHHADVNTNITKDDVKQHVMEVLDNIDATGIDSQIQSSLKTLVHIIRSFEMSLTGPKEEHLKPQGGPDGEEEDKLELTTEYVKEYAFEVINHLEAFHNAEEVQKALNELYHAFHLAHKGVRRDGQYTNITMAFLRQFAGDVFDDIKNNPNQTQAGMALNVIAHALYSIHMGLDGSDMGLDGSDQTTKGLHEHHEDTSFEDKLSKVKAATFKFFDVMETKLKGDSLHTAITEIIHLFAMIEMTETKYKHKVRPDENHPNERPLTPESVVQNTNRIIDECAHQGNEGELTMLLIQITVFLHDIEVKLDNYKPHPNSAYEGHGAGPHATPDLVKKTAVEVVDDLVTRYDGYKLDLVLGHMMEVLQQIQMHGLDHPGISHHGPPQGEGHHVQGGAHLGQGEEHQAPGRMDRRTEQENIVSGRRDQRLHEDFVNRHHKPTEERHHLRKQSDHPVPHEQTHHVPREHQRDEQEHHFENTEHHREQVEGEHHTQAEEPVLDVGTDMLSEPGLTGVSLGGNEAAPPQDDVNAAIPSRTFSGSDDHMPLGTKFGPVGHDLGGPHPRFMKKK